MSRTGRVRSRRGRSLAGMVLCLALLAFIQLSGPHASLNILWRFVILSFDNPATQLLDELALEKTPFTDALGDVVALARLATSASRNVLRLATEGIIPSEVLSARISRSPPLA